MSPLVRTPDVVELRSLCVAADLGSLGRAAVRLRISQPALTKRLQSLEALAGVRLLDRSPRGVTLTPAGRRVYEQARRMLEQAEAVEQLLEGLRAEEQPILLAASHSATDAFVAGMLVELHADTTVPVELLIANSQVVRTLVADGRAEVGVAAARPGGTPNPGVRELPLAEDEVVYAVPRGHRWERRARISREEFSRTPIVVRDPAANARATVAAVLARHDVTPPPLAAQASTPQAAKREALARGAPLMLSRHVLRDEPFSILDVAGLRFPRRWEVVLPAVGEPSPAVQRLVERVRAAVV